MERPRNPEHGDYASTLALQLSKKVGVPPRELAAALAEQLGRAPGIKSVEIAGPGLPQHPARRRRRRAARPGDRRGRRGVRPQRPRSPAQKINLEFVSANPTGPVHIGGVRWAAVGDALSRLLRATGAEVGTEYYFNDAGSQIDRFARSLLAAAKGEPAPEDGYGGAYIAEIAAEVRRAPAGGAATLDDAAAQEVFRVEGVALMFDEIQSSLRDFGVRLRHLLQREGPARPGRAGPGAGTGCASRATSSSPRARPGCAPPTSATTRTGCCASPTASGRTSPPTAPTTWTSASAASSGW